MKYKGLKAPQGQFVFALGWFHLAFLLLFALPAWTCNLKWGVKLILSRYEILVWTRYTHANDRDVYLIYLLLCLTLKVCSNLIKSFESNFCWGKWSLLNSSELCSINWEKNDTETENATNLNREYQRGRQKYETNTVTKAFYYPQWCLRSTMPNALQVGT